MEIINVRTHLWISSTFSVICLKKMPNLTIKIIKKFLIGMYLFEFVFKFFLPHHQTSNLKMNQNLFDSVNNRVCNFLNATLKNNYNIENYYPLFYNYKNSYFPTIWVAYPADFISSGSKVWFNVSPTGSREFIGNNP